MPTSPPLPCAHPGCPVLVRFGRCDEHRLQRQATFNSARGTAAERGYDAEWRAFVQSYRAGSGLDPVSPDFARQLIARNRCAACWREGRRTVSRLEFDHIVPLSEGGGRLDQANVQTLCITNLRIVARRRRFQAASELS